MVDQANNLRKRMEYPEGNKSAKTISIISGKGGVGKSNVALNFSIELLAKQQKVLIIDLDVGMGNINILLGLEPRKTIFHLFEEELSIYDIIEEGPNGLSFIAGGSGLSDFFLLDEHKKEYFFEQFNKLTFLYDYIIFDMGAGATKESLFFILASDECIVVTTPEPTAITDGYSMIKHIVNQGSQLPIHIILNRAKSQKDGIKTLENFQKVVSQFLQVDIQLLGILPEDDAVTQAVIRQIPYTLFDKKPRVALAIRDITRNYLTTSKKLNVIENRSFIQKLKSFIAR